MMKIDDYISENLKKPFKWGRHDCFTFAVGWVSLKTRINFLSDYGKWDDALSAKRAIDKVGTLADEIDRNLQRIPSKQAKDGDLCLVDNSLMLFYGRHIVGVGENGLVFKDRESASCCWQSC
jgi:hypothetical protein